MIERIVIQIVIFKCLKRFFSYNVVWFACFIGGVICYTTVFDPYGDYNQTIKLFIVLSVFFLIKTFEIIDDKRKSIIYSYLTGLSLGLCIMTVQTGLTYLISIIIFLILYFIVSHKKNILKVLTMMFLGTITIISLFCIYLSINHAFNPFVQQVLLHADSKGGVDNIIIIFIKNFINIESLNTALTIVVLLAHVYNINSIKSKKWYKLTLILTISVLINGLYSILRETLFPFMCSIGNSSIVQLIIGITITSIFITVIEYSTKNQKYIDIILAIIVFVSMYFITIISVDEVNSVYIDSSFIGLKNSLLSLIFYLSIFYILFEFFYFIKYKHTKNNFGLLIYIIISSSFQFVSFMNGGVKQFSFSGAYLCVPLIICVLFNIIQKIKIYNGNFSYALLFCAFSLFAVFSIMQRINCPYNWYGWKDSSISEENYYTINIDSLRGFRVDKRTKVTLEKVTNCIKYNSSEDDFVLTFPYVRIYNILSERMRIDDFVPLYWFDICSDYYADLDYEILEPLRPTIIVYEDVGEYAWEIHEKLFRNGNPVSQRKIDNWIKDITTNGEYTLIGQVSNISIFKYNDGSVINYSYFETESAFKQSQDDISYTKTTHSLLTEYDFINPVILYVILLIAALFVIIFAKKEWMKIAIIILTLNCILTIHPVFYLLYLILSVLVYTEENKKLFEKLFIIIFSAISTASLFGYTFLWRDLRVVYLFCAVLLIVAFVIFTVINCRKTISVIRE